MNKKFVLYGVVLILLLCVGMSYAYFTGNISGNKKEITVTSKNVRILFTDNNELTGGEILPGWKESKTFSVKNESKDVFIYNIIFKDLVNTFVTEGFLQYKITSSNGYNMSGYLDVPKSSSPQDIVLAHDIEIPSGVTQEYTIEFVYHDSEEIDQSEDMGKVFSGTIYIEEGTVKAGTLTSKILSDHPTRPGARPNLNSDMFVDSNTKTLYTASGNQTEDGKTVYYFAGNALDNWVYFAGIYWRIIRINEEGSVRLLYVGPDKNTEAGYIEGSTYNMRGDSMYFGYMYGSSGSLESNRENTNDSIIKGSIDTWYDDTIETNYDGYISKTAIYCNDRANEGYNTSIDFYFAAYKRLVNAKAPSYKCGNDASGNLYTGENGASDADKFTVNALTGNGKLTNPVALMTADEVAFAGGKYGTNAPAYYYYNAARGSVTGSTFWWTISPFDFYIGGVPRMFAVAGSSSSGSLSQVHVDVPDFKVRPVLSLKSCVKWKSGDGTSDSPYEVDIDSTCSEQNEKTKYNVEMNITGGTIKPSNVMVAEGESRKFTITPSEGYSLSNPTITCTGEASHTLNGSTLTISNVKSNQICTVILNQVLSLREQILADHPTRPGGRDDFRSVFVDDNIKTLYTTSGNLTEGGKIVYYFAGNALDNWVYFADLYWRIIRINEDGSVRLLYVGPDKNTESGYISVINYNIPYDKPRFVGYMYGNVDGSLSEDRKNNNDSNIKRGIDSWYLSNIANKYGNYVSKTAIYCNDRSSNDYSTTTSFYFDSAKRLDVITNHTPSYRCGNSADKFSSSSWSGGNGDLRYPVALMTADEVAFAGGSYGQDSPAYYYYNAKGTSVTGSEGWWTMSPFEFYTGQSIIYIFNVEGSYYPGKLTFSGAQSGRGYRPVLSLKACVKALSGDGTSDNPYTVGIDDSCWNNIN